MRCVLLALWGVFFALAAHADCRIALALANDVSRSVDLGETALDPTPPWRESLTATISEGEGRVPRRFDHQRRPGPVSALRNPQG